VLQAAARVCVALHTSFNGHMTCNASIAGPPDIWQMASTVSPGQAASCVECKAWNVVHGVGCTVLNYISEGCSATVTDDGMLSCVCTLLADIGTVDTWQHAAFSTM
jgi:hypothetical protein